jgi:hypothetical protein
MDDKNIIPRIKYNLDIQHFKIVDSHGNTYNNEIFIVPENTIICFQTPINKYGIAGMKPDLLKIYNSLYKKYKTNFLKNPKNYLNNFSCAQNFVYYYPGQCILDLDLKIGEANTTFGITTISNNNNYTNTNKINNKLSEYLKNNPNTFVILTSCRRCSVELLPKYTEIYYRLEYFYTIFNNIYFYKQENIPIDKSLITNCNIYNTNMLIYSQSNSPNERRMPINVEENSFYDPGLSLDINDQDSLSQLSMYYFVSKPDINNIQSIIKKLLDMLFDKLHAIYKSSKQTIPTVENDVDFKNYFLLLIQTCEGINSKIINILNYYTNNSMIDELETIAKFIISYKYIPSENNKELYNYIYKYINDLIANESFKRKYNNIYTDEGIIIYKYINLNLFENKIQKLGLYNPDKYPNITILIDFMKNKKTN